MARGPTLTGVAVLAILLILAGILVRGMRGRHGPDGDVRAPASRHVPLGAPR